MNFGGPGPMRPIRLKFRLRTRHRWIDAEVDTMHRRLIDALNRDDVDNGFVCESFAAFDDSPADHTTEHATVNLSSVLFALPKEDVGAPPPSDPFARIKKDAVRMEIGVGPYTITGNVFLVDGASPREALRLLHTRFFAVTRVTLRHVDRPSFREEHAVAFINRSQLDYITPVKG